MPKYLHLQPNKGWRLTLPEGKIVLEKQVERKSRTRITNFLPEMSGCVREDLSRS